MIIIGKMIIENLDVGRDTLVTTAQIMDAQQMKGTNIY